MFSKKTLGKFGVTIFAGSLLNHRDNRSVTAQQPGFSAEKYIPGSTDRYGRLKQHYSNSLVFAVPNDFPISVRSEISPAFDQSLKDWAENSTRKFQLLDFAPDDLALEIAFLRLLGVERVSLEELGRERGSTRCFIRNIPLVPDAQPMLTQSLDDVLNTIEEFRVDGHQHLRSLYHTVSDPVTHIKPALMNSIEFSINSHALEKFYKKVSELSDSDIIDMATHYLGDKYSSQQKALFAGNVRKARALCQSHVVGLDHHEAQTNKSNVKLR